MNEVEPECSLIVRSEVYGAGESSGSKKAGLWLAAFAWFHLSFILGVFVGAWMCTKFL